MTKQARDINFGDKIPGVYGPKTVESVRQTSAGGSVSIVFTDGSTTVWRALARVQVAS